MEITGSPASVLVKLPDNSQIVAMIEKYKKQYRFKGIAVVGSVGERVKGIDLS